MKLLVVLFLLVTVNAYAQVPIAPKNVRYLGSEVGFDGDEGATAAIASAYIYKYYVADVIHVLPTICTGTVKPWQCRATLPQLNIGNNVIYVAVQLAPNTPESVKSNPLIVFYAVNQKEIITNTTTLKQVVIRCQPGTYQMQRVTDATKLLAIVNGYEYVTNIVATSNAIYVFACLILEE